MAVVALYLFFSLFAVETYLEPTCNHLSLSKSINVRLGFLVYPTVSLEIILRGKWRILKFLSSSSWWNCLWQICRSYRTLISSNVIYCDFSFYFGFLLFRHLLMIHLTIYIAAATIWSLWIVIPYSVFSGSFSYSQTPIKLFSQFRIFY